VKKLALIIVGVLLIGGSLDAKKSLAALEERAARNPTSAKALYELTRRYCEEDSAVQAIETWKRLAELDIERASEVFLRAKVATYLGLEPFFPQLVSDSSAVLPRFSEDGTRIVFHALHHGRFDIAMMDFDGENREWVVEDESFHSSGACFAGSKTRILFVRRGIEDTLMELVYYDTESGEPEVLFSNLSPYVDSPDWGGEDVPVVFSYVSPETQSGGIATYDRQAGEFVELRNYTYRDGFPRYSSDAKQIVYASNRALQWDVYVMDTKGKDIERITDWPGVDFAPDFGDHNRKIAFVSDRNVSSQFDIFLYDRRTKEVIPVTYNEGQDDAPDLSDDGNWLLFQSTRGDGRPRAYIVPVNQPISAEKLLEEIAKGYELGGQNEKETP